MSESFPKRIPTLVKKYGYNVEKKESYAYKGYTRKELIAYSFQKGNIKGEAGTDDVGLYSGRITNTKTKKTVFVGGNAYKQADFCKLLDYYLRKIDKGIWNI